MAEEEEWLECSECGYRNKIKSLDARSENKCPSCGARGSLQQVEKEEDELVEIENLPYKIPKKKYLEIFDNADLSDDLIEMLQGDRPVTQSDVERLERRIEESGKREELLEAQTKTAEIKGEALEEAFNRVKKRRPVEKIDNALENAGFYDRIGKRLVSGFDVLSRKLMNPEKSLANILSELESSERREIMRDFFAASSGETSESPQSEKEPSDSSRSRGKTPSPEAGESHTYGLEEFSDEEVDSANFVFCLGLSKVLTDAIAKVIQEADSRDDLIRTHQRLKHTGCSKVKKLELIWDFSMKENELLSVRLDEDLERFLTTFAKLVLNKMKDSEYRNAATSVIIEAAKSIPPEKFRKGWESWKHDEEVKM